MIAIILGAICGIIFGLTGSGGGILATPFLLYGLKLPIHEAITITLITLSVTGIVGVLRLFSSKTIDWHAGITILLSGVVFSNIGSYLNPLINAQVLTNVFAIVLLMMSALIFKNSFHQQKMLREFSKISYYIHLLAIGSIAGFLNGLLGISGGVVIVSALIIFMNYSMIDAAAISIFIVAILSSISTITHFVLTPESFNLKMAFLFISGSAIGMYFTAEYAHILPEKYVKRGLALLVFLIGAFMLINGYFTKLEKLF